jgi:CHAD domain-containing protein
MREYAVERIGGLLESFHKELNRAAKHRDEEGIHDLRVSIRRLRASLRTFHQFFPETKVKKVRRRLRRLMDFAGEVRDRDIALNLLAEAGLQQSDMATALQQERDEAEQDLHAEVRRWSRRKYTAKWPQRLHLFAQ